MCKVVYIISILLSDLFICFVSFRSSHTISIHFITVSNRVKTFIMKFFCVLLSILVGVVTSKKLPSYLELCPKSVKEAGPCIMKNVKILQQKMEKGIPELFIPAFNPLELTKIQLDSGNIKIVLTNYKIYNLHKFVLKNVDFNLETLDLDIDVNYPEIFSNADYGLNGKILILEINGKGRSEANFTNLSANFKGQGELYEKNGQKHIKTVKTDIKLSTQDAKFYFDRLFGDNNELTENANKVINENIKDVLKEFLPMITEVIKGIVNGVTNRIFEKFTFDELFP